MMWAPASATRYGAPMRSQPVVAGVIAALVGFASSFAIVLAGLGAVGATDRQASSGLLVLSVSMGAVGMWMSWRQRLPIGIVWSTPGAALLVSSGAVEGGYRAAVGAFVLAGALTVVAGLWQRLAGWIAMIPGPIASALLAGVLLPVCIAPATSMVEETWLTLPVVIVWVAMMRLARRWAVPAAFVAMIVAVAIGHPESTAEVGTLWPSLVLVAPRFDIGALVGLGVPLFIVTMASQNVAGMAVLRSFGFAPRLRPLLVTTGATTMATASFGAHGVNLAALTGALLAGPEAGDEPERRWIAGVTSGATYLVLGLMAGLATALVSTVPHILIEAFAGLALMGALAGALATAMSDAQTRDAVVVTLVVSASGITAAGISAPFWGLAAGLVVHGSRFVRLGRG
jgi:benzoate membrane transport protein